MQNYTDLIKQDQVASKGTFVHPMAVVSKGAELGNNVWIGPNAIVGSSVKLDDGVMVNAGAFIEGNTTIGKNTKVFPFATIGCVPQDLKSQDTKDMRVEIGENNLIREYVNVSLGTEHGGGLTKIGSNNLLMCYTHIAHDCFVGDNCIFANGVQIAGHVITGNKVVFGGLTAVHQFVKIGDYAMMGGGSMVAQDIAPFCMVQGDRATVHGLNAIGIRRSGLKNVSVIKEMFKIYFKENLTHEDALNRIESSIQECEEKNIFVTFLKSSNRGVCR